MPSPDAATLLEMLARGDLDELVTEVDRRASQRDWAAVHLLRDRCRTAAEDLGKQLWGVAQYADYRIALDAPPEQAAAVVVPGAGRFALGPLTEVVAQHHVFGDLADHVDAVVAAVVAQERILRGEDLRDDPRATLDELGLPGVLQAWEPAYALPTYRAADRLDGEPPGLPPGATPVDTAPGMLRELPRLTRALLDLAEPWASESTGEVHVAAVTGDAAAAVAALVPGEASIVRLPIGDAFALMAAAASSGGAHGRRRGAAAGRVAAWWVGCLATGLEHPADPDELEFRLEDLGWWAFDTGLVAGWRLALAIEDPVAGWAVAIDAHDIAPEEPDLADGDAEGPGGG